MNTFKLLTADGFPAEVGQLVSTDEGLAGVLCWWLAPIGDSAMFAGGTVLVNTGDFTINVPPETFQLRWTKVRELT